MAYYNNNSEKYYIFGEDGGKKLVKTLDKKLLTEILLEKSINKDEGSSKLVASQAMKNKFNYSKPSLKRFSVRQLITLCNNSFFEFHINNCDLYQIVHNFEEGKLYL